MLAASFMEQKLPKPSNHYQRERLGLGIPNDATHHSLEPRRETSSSMIDLLPQWGSRKKFRFTKNSEATGDDELLLSSPVRKITNARLDRKSVAVKDRFTSGGGGRSGGCGNFNCHSASAPPTTRHVLRNSEIMRVQQTNGGGVNQEKKKHHHHHQNHHENGGASSDFDGKKGGLGIGGGGGSSSSSEAVPAVWPHKFVIALTNKEKEEDFMAIKGTKLPQRPKKRSKLIQRTLNAVSPGAWLCDLTLDRYEVKEKKTSKKTRRGLKAMGNKSSDSE
ncbi:unnamed protein product [Rhodiola kirilowii]